MADERVSRRSKRALPCPHCQTAVVLAELPHPTWTASYRECPECRQLLTVDAKTKRRQAFAIVTAVLALVLTALQYFRSGGWLTFALMSYVLLALQIWWGNKRVKLVPYADEPHPGGGR